MRCFTVVVAVIVAACGGGGSGAKTDGGGGGDDSQGPTADADLAGTTDVSIIVEPDGSNAAQLVSAITAATTSIDMTMYELSDDRIINGLIARAKAGVNVQAILDSATGAGAQGGVDNKSFNMDAYTKLNAGGVATVWSSTEFTFTHEKTIVIDNATAWIMTMNATTSAPNSNREYLAIDTDPADIAEATAIFTADHAMTQINPSGPLVVANNNARSELVALIDTATTSLDVEGEEFSDLNTNGIVQAVTNAANRGVTVHVVVANDDPDPTSVNRVKLAGAHVVMTGPTSSDGTTSNPYIHAKAVVVDCNGTSCARGFVGSENFSTGSLSYNRELGVIVKAPSELAKVKTAIDADFAAGVAQ
jgi:cardiolipin synthase A/B